MGSPLPWIYDDGGRLDAGFKGEAPGDCVTRSIAIATGMPYLNVYNDLSYAMYNAGSSRSARNGIIKNVWKKYLNDLGWHWTPTMQIGSGCTVHLAQDELPNGKLIVSVSKHITAVIDGVIRDNHDPSRDGTRCVYGYYSQG